MEIINHSIYSMRLHNHNGWSDAEDAQLFAEVKKSRESGKPLRAAFDHIAELTGRKSNRIFPSSPALMVRPKAGKPA